MQLSTRTRVLIFAPLFVATTCWCVYASQRAVSARIRQNQNRECLLKASTARFHYRGEVYTAVEMETEMSPYVYARPLKTIKQVGAVQITGMQRIHLSDIEIESSVPTFVSKLPERLSQPGD